MKISFPFEVITAQPFPGHFIMHIIIIIIIIISGGGSGKLNVCHWLLSTLNNKC